MTTTNTYKQQIQQLEQELEEMTAALTQAWDQLVPFLQETPPGAETAQDMAPIIQAVIAAADTELGAIYLFESGECYSVPNGIRVDDNLKRRLRKIRSAEIFQGEMGAQWAFAPVISEHDIIGVLGIGTANSARTFTSVDLRIVVRMAERVGSQIEAAQLAHSREREATLLREMKIANEIQQSIQPHASPHVDGIDIASFWLPAKQVGGDAWGWSMQSNNRLAWFALDVAGKGLPAALAAVSLHTAIHIGLRMDLAPDDVLRVVNEELYEAYTLTDLMATAVILSYDPATNEVQLANAGHPPLLVRQDYQWLQLMATAPPIGVLPDLDAERQHISLNSNDLIICYSDGFSEIETPTGLWGADGLQNAIPDNENSMNNLIDHIVRASRKAGSAFDDQTLIAAIFNKH